MQGRLDGYITDLGYTHGYYRELNPQWARLAFLKAGLAPPTVATACELGFGQGLSLAMHAAASSVTWHGTDVNTEHVAFAGAMVRAAGVEAMLHQETFAEYAARRDLPDFDFIALNGVWSWVSEASRRCIVDFVRRRLRVGGLLFVSYNTLAGWAPHLALRELLVARANDPANRGAPLLDRIEEAIAFVGRSSETTPAMAERLATIRGQDRRYVAHEYFNDHFCPMPFSTVAAALAPAGVTYVGSAAIGELPSVHLDRAEREQLQMVDGAVEREEMRDTLTNRPFRQDYWVKGPLVRLGETERDRALRATRVVAVQPRPALPVKLRVVLALNGGELSESVYRPILDVLAEGRPVSLASIERTLAGVPLSQIFDAVLLIAGEKQLAPVQDECVAARAEKATARLNAHILDMLPDGEGLEHLASPVTGGGVRVDRLAQLVLLARRRGLREPQAWARLALQFSPADDPGKVAARAQSFAREELPLLQALQIA